MAPRCSHDASVPAVPRNHRNHGDARSLGQFVSSAGGETSTRPCTPLTSRGMAPSGRGRHWPPHLFNTGPRGGAATHTLPAYTKNGALGPETPASWFLASTRDSACSPWCSTGLSDPTHCVGAPSTIGLADVSRAGSALSNACWTPPRRSQCRTVRMRDRDRSSGLGRTIRVPFRPRNTAETSSP